MLLLDIVEAIKHQPIQYVCLQDTHSLYRHLAGNKSGYAFEVRVEM